jgi:hypothetical protein
MMVIVEIEGTGCDAIHAAHIQRDVHRHFNLSAGHCWGRAHA